MSLDDPTPTRVKLVIDEVLDGRVDPTREGVRAHVDDVYAGLPGFSRTDLVGRVMNEINSWSTKKEKKPMSPPKSVLRGNDTIAPAAEVLREEPDLTAREVYQRLCAAGYRMGMAEESFVTSDKCKRARELLESGDPIDVPAPPEPVAEPKPKPDEPVSTPPQSAEAEPVAVGPTRSNGAAVEAGDGDYVRFQLGGQKLDAQREGDEWDIAFEGNVGDGIVRELLGRVFGGPR